MGNQELGSRDDLRASTHPRQPQQAAGRCGLSIGPWFVLVLAFLVSMAWGVLVAFAADGTAQPKAESSAASPVNPPSSPSVSQRRTAPVAASLATFKPALLVYRQAEGEDFKKPAGVFVDRETGEVVVVDSGNNLVSLLSPQGVPLFSFGYNGEIPQPSQAVVDRSGRFLVLAGMPRKVKVFSYRGEPLGDFAFPGFEGAAQALPTALTVDRAGNVYIADSTSGRILVYDDTGRLTVSFGKRGEGLGGFNSVTGIAVDQSGRIYVADAQHKPAIQVFNPEGDYLRGWGEHSGGPQNFSLPGAIGLDATGRVLVVDTIRQTISVFTPEGNFLFRFGGLGTAPGAFGYPTGLDVDSSGRLYVTESINARVQVFELADASAASDARTRQAPAAPPSVREEMRRGLGEVLKEIQK